MGDSNYGAPLYVYFFPGAQHLSSQLRLSAKLFLEVFSVVCCVLFMTLQRTFPCLYSYFVKLSWGWTLSLLLPFIGLTNYIVTRSVPAVFRRIGALLVGTIIWYSCTNIFMYIENATGSCYVSTSQLENKTEHGDKSMCIKSGGFWVGFDISGHSFLLPYCVLMILEEAAILRDERFKKHEMKALIHALVVCLGLLAFIWTFMFFCTSIYFHTPSQKLFGTFFGILAWYVTYRQWYLKAFSPGLPPSLPPGKIHRKSK